MNDSTLTFGLRDALPEGTEHAWGARFIVTQDGHVDLPNDRQDVISTNPDTQRAFLEDLMASITMGELTGRIKRLLLDGTINTREAGRVVLHDDGNFWVVGDTRASAGYLYVVAWCDSPMVA